MDKDKQKNAKKKQDMEILNRVYKEFIGLNEKKEIEKIEQELNNEDL